MDSDKLEQLLSVAMQTPDGGFTESVVNALPPTKVPFMQKWQWRLWGSTSVIIMMVSFFGAKYANFSSPTGTSFISIALISVALVWTHFGELLE